ncbi:MAG: ParB N-terminal domain-containing protein [Dolichospermum sp.]
MSKIKRGQIEEWDIDELTPYENNAKLHPDSHIEQIANSIEEFTFLDPIAVDENGEVLEGHGRLLAAKKRGDNTIPVIQITGLSDAQKVAYRLAHNKLTMNTGFDPEMLKIDFEFLQDSEFELSLTGFEELELSFLDDEPEDNNNNDDSNSGEDDYEQPEEIISRVKLDEIWQLGRHFICCGDSTIESNVRALLGDRFGDVGMVWSDPPYGMRLDADYSKMGKGIPEIGVKKSKGYANVIGDHEDFDPSVLINLFHFVKEHFWWGFDYYAERLNDRNNGSIIVWDKRVLDALDPILGSSFELCWSKVKHKREIARIQWSGYFGTEKEFDRKRCHPTQKPTLLCEWFFEKYGDSDDVIFDPFLGSAPSIIAAQKMEGDRTVYGFELSPDYCEVIIQRFEKFTGIEAKLIGTLSTKLKDDTQSEEYLNSLGF